MKIVNAIAYLRNLPPDEPVFILRGQDLLAPSTITHWCGLHHLHGGDPAKRSGAALAASELLAWPKKKLPD
jgi:hypothetical protein